jgi:DNA polymerase III subunit delta
MLQTAEAVLKDLKAKKFAPIYFLHGEEPYYIDLISNYIEENALSAADKGFNQIILYGKDITIGSIINQARRFPMMAERQVVIVKELTQMADWGKESANEIFEKYLAQPLSSTTLVLNHKYKLLAKTTKLYKALEKAAVVVESKKMYENQVPVWIQDYLKERGYSIQPKATQLLTEAIGADLSRLHTELEKISLNAQKDRPIDEHLIEKYVGISKDYNVFELQKAIGERNHLKAKQILDYWAANPKKQPLIPTLAMIFSYFTKLLLAYSTTDRSEQNLAGLLKISPYAIKEYRQAMQNHSYAQVIQAIHFLRQADLQTKGIAPGGDSEAEILKELIFKLI